MEVIVIQGRERWDRWRHLQEQFFAVEFLNCPNSLVPREATKALGLAEALVEEFMYQKW